MSQSTDYIQLNTGYREPILPESEHSDGELADDEGSSSASSETFREANRVLLNLEGTNPLPFQLASRKDAKMVQQSQAPSQHPPTNFPLPNLPPPNIVNPQNVPTAPNIPNPTIPPAAPMAPAGTLPAVPIPAGPTELPLKGTRTAPKTFRGKYTEIEDFIDHYERLLDKHNITDDAERCEEILAYCSSSVKTVIRSMDEYQAKDWDVLKQELLKLYDAERARHRYLPYDVSRFSQKSALRSITDLSDWRIYCRKYQQIAGSLRKENKISEMDYRMHFFHGIPPPLRIQLEEKLWRAYPNHDITQYFPINQVSAQAEQHFHRSKFTTLHAPAPMYVQESDEDSSDDESSTSSDTESSASSDDRRRSDKKKKKGKTKKHSRQRKDRSRDKVRRVENIRLETREHVTKPQGTADEVQDLIRQLGTLRVDDSAYATLYYRAIQLDPSGAVEKCVRSPYVGTIEGKPTVPAYNPTASIPLEPQPTNFLPNPYPPRRLPAPFQGNRPPPFNNRGMGNPRSFEARMEPSNECFGCGIPGHKIHECEVIQQKLLLKEIVREPSTNRYVMADGEWIKRNGNESIATAVDRILENRRPTVAGKSLLLTLKDNVQAYLTRQDSDEEGEEFDEKRMLPEESDDELDSDENEWEDTYWDNRFEPEMENQTFEECSNKAEESFNEEDSESSTRTLYAGRPSHSYAAERQEGKGREARNRAMETPRASERPKRITRPTIQADGTPASQTWKRRPEPILRRKLSKPEELPDKAVTSPIKQPELVPTSTGPSQTKETPPKLTAPQPIEVDHSMEDVEMRNVRPQKTTPVDARTVRFQKPLETPIGPIRPQERLAPIESKRRTEKPVQQIDIPNPYSRRSSELTNQVSKGDVIKRILDSPVTIPIREVLGSSGDLCRELLDMIKLRNPVPKVMNIQQQSNRELLEQFLRAWIGQNKHAAGNGQLIRVPMKNNGYIFEGIIDTGSELNVLNSKLVDLGIVAAPIDITQETKMGDANGGEGKLTGVIEDVGLGLGPLRLHGDFFIGENIPFDALLGRPWQTRNRISIDERAQGTFLVFKDEHYNKTHEMIAVPTNRDPVSRRGPPRAMYTVRTSPITVEGPSHTMDIESVEKRPTALGNESLALGLRDDECLRKDRESHFTKMINEPQGRTYSLEGYSINELTRIGIEKGSDIKLSWQMCDERNQEGEKGVVKGTSLEKAMRKWASLVLNLFKSIGRTAVRVLSGKSGQRKGEGVFKKGKSEDRLIPSYNDLFSFKPPNQFEPRTSHLPEPLPVPDHYPLFLHPFSIPAMMDPSQPPTETTTRPIYGDAFVRNCVAIPPHVGLVEGLTNGGMLARSEQEHQNYTNEDRSSSQTICFGSPTAFSGIPYELTSGHRVQDHWFFDAMITFTPRGSHLSENLVTGCGKLTLLLDDPYSRREPAFQVPPVAMDEQAIATQAAFPRTPFTSYEASATASATDRVEPPESRMRPAMTSELSTKAADGQSTENYLTTNNAHLTRSIPALGSDQEANVEEEGNCDREKARDQAEVNKVQLYLSDGRSFSYPKTKFNIALCSKEEGEKEEGWMDHIDMELLATQLRNALEGLIPRQVDPLPLKQPISFLLRQLNEDSTSLSQSTIQPIASESSMLLPTVVPVANPTRNNEISPEITAILPTLAQMMHDNPKRTLKLLEHYSDNEAVLVEEARRFQQKPMQDPNGLATIGERNEFELGYPEKEQETDPLTRSSIPRLHIATDSLMPPLSNPNDESSSPWSPIERAHSTLTKSDDAMSISNTPVRASQEPGSLPCHPIEIDSSDPESSSSSSDDEDMPALEPLAASDVAGALLASPIQLDETSEKDENKEGSQYERGRSQLAFPNELQEKRPLPPVVSPIHVLAETARQVDATERQARALLTTFGNKSGRTDRTPPSTHSTRQGEEFVSLQPLVAVRHRRDYKDRTESEQRKFKVAVREGHFKRVWKNIPATIPLCGWDLLPVGEVLCPFVHALQVRRCAQAAISAISIPTLGQPAPLVPNPVEHIGFFSQQIPDLIHAVQSHMYSSQMIQCIRYPAVELERYIHIRHDDPCLAPALSPLATKDQVEEYEDEHCFTTDNPLMSGDWHRQVRHLTVLRNLFMSSMDGFGFFLALKGLQDEFKTQFTITKEVVHGHRYCELLFLEEQQWFLTFIMVMTTHRERTMAVLAEMVLCRRFEDEKALRYLMEEGFIMPRSQTTFPCVESFTHEEFCLKLGYELPVQDYQKPLGETNGHYLLDEPYPEYPTTFQGYDFTEIETVEGSTREDLSGLVRHLYPGTVVPSYRPAPLPFPVGSVPWVKMSLPGADSYADNSYTTRLSGNLGGMYFQAPGTYRPWLLNIASRNKESSPEGPPPSASPESSVSSTENHSARSAETETPCRE